MKKNIIFLSHPLSNNTIGYGGHKEFKTERIRDMSKGDACNQSFWKLSNHIGTHLDTPFHFSVNGKQLHEFEAAHWVYNNVHLVDLSPEQGELILPNDWCKAIPSDTELLILRTGFEKCRDTEAYWAKNPGLSKELGHWLRENRPSVRTIGFDLISITSYLHRSEGKVAHRAFLCPSQEGRPLVVIEDMKLSEINSKIRSVVISPLIVEGADGSPVTVIADIE